MSSRFSESAIESNEFQRLRNAVSGNNGSSELESIGGSQWMVQHYTLGVTSSGIDVPNFNPSRCDFVNLVNCTIP